MEKKRYFHYKGELYELIAEHADNKYLLLDRHVVGSDTCILVPKEDVVEIDITTGDPLFMVKPLRKFQPGDRVYSVIGNSQNPFIGEVECYSDNKVICRSDKNSKHDRTRYAYKEIELEPIIVHTEFKLGMRYQIHMGNGFRVIAKCVREFGKCKSVVGFDIQEINYKDITKIGRVPSMQLVLPKKFAEIDYQKSGVKKIEIEGVRVGGTYLVI